MPRAKRFNELLQTISEMNMPLGIGGNLGDRMAADHEAIESLREEDIPIVFDLIGYEPPRKLWPDRGERDGVVVLFLGTLVDKYPKQFLDILEQRIDSIPTALPLIAGVEDGDQAIGRAICELASSRRCLTPHERALLKEKCAIIGCSCCFSRASLSSSWITSDVLALATGIDQNSDFSAMPILADALQDAGCDSADVLSHCRGLRSHVCGCWVVDLVLGKEGTQ